MSKTTKENILGFIAMAILAALMVYMVIRDMDKDTEKVCGYERYEGAPEYCGSWWDDKKVPANTAIKLNGINGTEQSNEIDGMEW
ncbi:hypothetical protein IKS86_04600 [bacterium]|nr:hypothetical protein [bacterium]